MSLDLKIAAQQQREDGEQLKALKETVKVKKGDVEKMTLRLNEVERDNADLRSQKERTTTEGEGTRTLRQRQAENNDLI